MQQDLQPRGGAPRLPPIRRTNSLGEFRPDGTHQYVGVQIRTGRRLLGLTRDALAQRLGAESQTIASYEHGACEVPPMMMARMAEILNKPLPWFFHRPADADQSCSKAAASRANPAPRTRVLLVDDAPDVLLILGAFLEGAGLEVVKAASGDEALRVIASDTVLHAVVTDSVMPGLSGPDLLMQTTQLRPSLPSLIVTGYAEDLKRFSELPKTVGVLRKPFRREDLVRRVYQMVGAPEDGSAVAAGTTQDVSTARNVTTMVGASADTDGDHRQDS